MCVPEPHCQIDHHESRHRAPSLQATAEPTMNPKLSQSPPWSVLSWTLVPLFTILYLSGVGASISKPMGLCCSKK